MNQSFFILAFKRIYHVEAALSPAWGQLHAWVLRPFQQRLLETAQS